MRAAGRDGIRNSQAKPQHCGTVGRATCSACRLRASAQGLSNARSARRKWGQTFCPPCLPAQNARSICQLGLPTLFARHVCPPYLPARFACPLGPLSLPAQTSITNKQHASRQHDWPTIHFTDRGRACLRRPCGAAAPHGAQQSASLLGPLCSRWPLCAANWHGAMIAGRSACAPFVFPFRFLSA